MPYAGPSTFCYAGGVRVRSACLPLVAGIAPKGRAPRDEKGSVRNLRLSKGFAHRFWPTYPGFPVEVGGDEQRRAAFFERRRHRWSWLGLRSRKSGQSWCEHGAPVRSRGNRDSLRARTAVSHISRKTSEMLRISCMRLWIGQRVRLSVRRAA
jgi:hypothetical protein